MSPLSDRGPMSQLKQFGKYEIVRKLSRSLTDVYLARDPGADRLVVLKLIEQTRDEFTNVLIEAERRGALLQKQLHQTDARILEVFDFGEQQNCFFVALEYCEGRTLTEVVRQERTLDPKRAAHYAAEISDQLKTLHSFVLAVDGRQTAVVHGDIKPSNIQIGLNDEVRLLDFGIAKVISLTHNLTYQNFGSPSYCSPERLSKGQVDAHADLWALGVSLYEMVSGVPPYQAENTRKLENLIQSGRPVRALPETCPRRLKAVIEKSLAANLAERYPSAAAFQEDLLAFLADRPTVAETETRSQWNAAPTVAKHAVSTRATRLSAKTRTVFRLPQRTVAVLHNDRKRAGIALAVGLIFGLFVLMPLGYFYRLRQASEPLRAPADYAHLDIPAIDSDWNLYRQLKTDGDLLGRFSPVASLTVPLKTRLLAAADRVIDAFHAHSARPLSDFDWAKAQLCLRHALELDPSDDAAKGKLALCRAYANLAQNPGLPKAAESFTQFREAERFLPKSPHPHLGLARLYVYSYRNISPALAEMREAERLGYRIGPKEAEQKADGYLYRAEWELIRAKYTIPDPAKKKWVALARTDLERARHLYEPIAGYSHVDQNLKRLGYARVQEIALETLPIRKRSLSARRWQ